MISVNPYVAPNNEYIIAARLQASKSRQNKLDFLPITMSRINLSVSVLSIGISISTKLLDAGVSRKDKHHAVGIDQF